MRRSAPPPPAPAPAPRAYSPPPPLQLDDDEPPPTEYAKVSRVGVLKVAAVLLGVEGPLEGQVIRIYQGENVIGREAEPEAKESVPSTHASISRKHAKLTADGGYFVLEPVQLKNATLAGGAPVDTHAVLQHGDRITLGTTKPCTFVLLAVPA
jgi:pSer/pThr/pTyr-binding forkhead associated (FHA) protein